MTRRGDGLILWAALAVALCGCDIHDHPAPSPSSPASGVALNDGWGLATPETIGEFTRADVVHGTNPEHGTTAGYSHIVGDDAVIATISVRPWTASDVLIPAVNINGGGVDGSASARALAASIAQVRRFYPKAAVITQDDAFLVQRGALQQGKRAVLEYHELHDGQQRAMRLRVYSFCCLGGQWSYEYRFRYPATVDDDLAISVFLRESSWTIAPPS
jgi:hypothetical protein